VRDEVGERGDLQRADGGGDREEEDEPERDGADQVRRATARAHPLDVLACIRVVQGAVDAGALEDLVESGLDELGDDVADEQDDQEPDDVRDEPDQRVEALLDGVGDLDCCEHWRLS
jgi:hypothetical protein